MYKYSITQLHVYKHCHLSICHILQHYVSHPLTLCATPSNTMCHTLFHYFPNQGGTHMFIISILILLHLNTSTHSPMPYPHVHVHVLYYLISRTICYNSINKHWSLSRQREPIAIILTRFD